MKLNIGCGQDSMNGYINLDGIKLPGVDIVHDLDIFPYPFKDNYFDEIFSAHVLEHVGDLGKVMTELVRITKNGGEIKVVVPYFTNPGTWADYTHKRAFTVGSFDYFRKDFFYNKGLDIELIKLRIHFFWNKKTFMKSRGINIFPDFFINIVPRFYERFFAYMFPSCEIHYLLKVNK